MASIFFSGALVGQALSEHPLIRKIGFTGSTPVGKTIMERYIYSDCVQSLPSVIFIPLIRFLFVLCSVSYGWPFIQKYV